MHYGNNPKTQGRDKEEYEHHFWGTHRTIELLVHRAAWGLKAKRSVWLRLNFDLDHF